MSNPTPITITPAEAAGLQDYEARGVVQLGIKDVEALLGVCRSTVDELIKTRQLPTMKVGRSVKIPIAGFKKFIAKAMAKS